MKNKQLERKKIIPNYEALDRLIAEVEIGKNLSSGRLEMRMEQVQMQQTQINPDYKTLNRSLIPRTRITKNDFYDAMVGNIGTLDFGISLAFYDLDIDEKGMEKIYQVIKIMEDYYVGHKAHSDYQRYYEPSFKKIKEVYSSKDLNKFKDALNDLLGCIASD